MTTSLYTGNTCVACGGLLKHDDARTTMPNHCVFCRREADQQEFSDSRKPSPFLPVSIREFLTNDQDLNPESIRDVLRLL
jgi:hypothetical protein